MRKTNRQCNTCVGTRISSGRIRRSSVIAQDCHSISSARPTPNRCFAQVTSVERNCFPRPPNTRHLLTHLLMVAHGCFAQWTEYAVVSSGIALLCLALALLCVNLDRKDEVKRQSDKEGRRIVCSSYVSSPQRAPGAEKMAGFKVEDRMEKRHKQSAAWPRVTCVAAAARSYTTPRARSCDAHSGMLDN